MDDIEDEFRAAVDTCAYGETGVDISCGFPVEKKVTTCSLLPPPVFPEAENTSGFHKTIKLCLLAIKDAMLHHRWDDAAKSISHYTQALEDTSSEKQRMAPEIMWRLGCEILHHHPNSRPEDITDLYERMKHFGVKNYSKISLDHTFHMLTNGHLEEARRHLSIAESWRYGKETAVQSQDLALIRAYRGFLDYIIWRNRRSVRVEEDHHGDDGNQEMHSYFRQASVGLKELIKCPGVWDPFVLAYVEMLEFYNDQDGAERLLKDYAYDKAFPANPNAHVYLYEFLRRNNAPEMKLIKVLEILRMLVPSHKLMLQYCIFLLNSGSDENNQKALTVIMDLLEYTSWKQNPRPWNCLKDIFISLYEGGNEDVIAQEWERRKALWMPLHFRAYHARCDARVDKGLQDLKKLIVRRVAGKNDEYRRAANKVLPDDA